MLYRGFGLIFPLSLGLSVYYLVRCNLVGVVLALVLVLAWTGVIFDAAERRHLVDWTTELRHLGAGEFELLVGEVFRREGWSVRRLGALMVLTATSTSSSPRISQESLFNANVGSPDPSALTLYVGFSERFCEKT